LTQLLWAIVACQVSKDVTWECIKSSNKSKQKMYSRNSQMMMITNVMDGCDFTCATTHLIISFIGQLRVTEIDFGLFCSF
jgi:hypothetical protein